MVSSTYLSRGIVDAELAARRVLETEPAGSEWRYAGLVPLGQALFLAGRSEEARAPLEEARTLPGARRRATSLLALAYLSLIELDGGDPQRSESLARDALALADEIGHATTPAAANAHLALGCALMAGTDLHLAIDHLEKAVQLSGGDEPSYWHAHANIHLGAALHLLGDSVSSRDALSRARAELDELPDVGMLGELYWKTDDALQHRARHEGFLGQELSEAERRVLDLLLKGLTVSQVAQRAVALTEHGQDTSAEHLQKARRDDARTDDRACRGGRDRRADDVGWTSRRNERCLTQLKLRGDQPARSPR